MSKFIRRAQPLEAGNEYAQYSLIDNPFPATPAAEYGSPDERNNGAIYDPAIRPEKGSQFEARFLRTPFGRPHILMGYLMSLGAVESMRGMGKTAMLLHYARAINDGFGPPLTGTDQRVVAVYVFPTQGTKRLDQLAWISVRSFIEQVGADVWVSSLLDAASKGLISLPADVDPNALRSRDAVERIGRDSGAIGREMRLFLTHLGVHEDLGTAIAAGWGNPELTLNSLQNLPERRRNSLAMTFWFDSIPSYLRGTGFTGLYWFVDELENVVNSQSANERIGWAKELRTQIVDGNTTARQYGFIFPVFVTHAGVNTVLSQAWTRSGLDQFAPMYKETDTYTVELDELNVADSRRLIQAYLDHFRTDEAQTGQLDPFTVDAIQKLARDCNYHPREMLRQAHLVLRRAAVEGVDRIDPKFFKGSGSADDSKSGRTRKGSKAKAILGLDG